LNARGKHKEAEAILHQVVELRRKTLGEEHLDTALGYNNLASALSDQGKYAEAEKALTKALGIRRKLLGDEHIQIAFSYNNLAVNSIMQGKYTQAEENLRKALTIFEKLLGEQHPHAAQTYSNLAYTLNAQGKYREAEALYRKALAIRGKLLGEEHPDTAQSYNNLASNLNAQGKHAEAEEALRKALAVYRKTLGEEHSLTAMSYNNLAANLIAQGQYAAAEEGYRKALAIYRRVLGEKHPSIATSYNNLALNLKAQRQYAKAEESFRQALDIRREALGEEHPDTATSYEGLAINCNAQGKYREAEEGLQRALAIRRKVLGEEHPLTASSYNDIAANLNSQGKYEQAEENFRKALAIRCKVQGEEHPYTALSYTNLAGNLNAQGKYSQAEVFWRSATESFSKARLRIAATGLGRATITSEHSPLPAFTAILVRNGKLEDAWQRFEESLARGTWDDLSARLKRPQSERDKQAQIAARIDRLQKLIEKTSVAKPTPEQSKQRDGWLSQLLQAYDDLAVFTKQLEEKYGPVAGQVFVRAQIQAALPADTALIAWLDIPGQPKAVDPNGEHWAILLRSSGAAIVVRLHGSGDNSAWPDADTQLPAKLRAALQSSDSDWQPLAGRLRKQRFDPLAPHLQGVRRLIVLPSAALAGVPVEVIADGYTISYAHSATMYAYLLGQPPPTGKGLLVLADPVFDPSKEKEEAQPLPPGGILITMVLPGSNADQAKPTKLKPGDVLLRYGDTELNKPADFKPQPETNDSNKLVPVIVWREGVTHKQPLFVRPGKLGVLFAPDSGPQAVAEQRRWDRKLASALRGGDGDWKRLPGTRIEAAALQRLFGSSTRLLQKSEASEQRLNELAASGELGHYRYIHLATHGEVNNLFPLRSAVILSRDHLPDDKQRTELLLSGQPIPDGRLEADEALRRWDLHADLVTLSACQTALGKYELGEGFVGFAQSLTLCGTRSVCLSLWKVDDTATALLMERFYQNLLGKRQGLDKPMAKAAALAEAKTWLRTLPRDEVVKRVAALMEGESRSKGATKLPLSAAAKGQRGDSPFAHPHYWAAFILSGDPQ
jgi:tetratricopeptide (TPR) repeat protein